jgi:hypothetical protein
MESDTQKRLLDRAVHLLGRRPLAAALDVPLSILDYWTAGAPMPESQFLAVVAQILDDLDRRELHG